MKAFKDQMNNIIRLETSPRRIISLVPSQTQLLNYFGLEEEVVGITKFCIHPDEWFRSKPRVGGTKSVSVEKVQNLNPDLIIGNKEENLQENIEDLEGVAPIWMSDIFCLEDALQMILSIGEITGKLELANQLNNRILSEFNSLKNWEGIKQFKDKRVLYFIWHEPGMLAGKNTFIDDMLKKCGLMNVAEGARYPELTKDENPDFVFLSSEPFPFKENHIEEYEQMFPNAKIVLVDGEMFSWYGSKLKDAPSYFRSLLEKLTV